MKVILITIVSFIISFVLHKLFIFDLLMEQQRMLSFNSVAYIIYRISNDVRNDIKK